MNPLPPANYLWTCLDLNPETGELRWKLRPREHFKCARTWASWNTRNAGRLAGSYNGSGARQIRIDGDHFSYARIVWRMTTGEDPVRPVKHLSRNRSDFRPSNLHTEQEVST